MKNIYYTLIYKMNYNTCFQSFASFEGLKDYVEEHFKNCDTSNLKPVDKEFTIFYLEQDRGE